VTTVNQIKNILNNPFIDLSSDLNEQEEGVNIITIDVCCKSILTNQYNDKWNSPEALHLFFPNSTYSLM
jgi:adenine specific DNA methylase Mod